MPEGPARANWAGSYTYRARRLHRPASLEQLQELVAGAAALRVLGTRHSFSGIADGEEQVTLDALPREVAVDARAGAVTLTANVTYGQLDGALREAGVALGNLASLPHISVAGAIATATHGSGEANGNLATAVQALELVTAAGEVLRVGRGDAGFEGIVVSLGMLGVVTRLTLDVEPAYEVTQRVFDGLAFEDLLEHFDAVMGAGYSVSAFTTWGAGIDTVWVKRRAEENDAPLPEVLLQRSVPADAPRHPIPGIDPVHCTEQLGVPGPWSDRLPHFRLGFTPSSGEEIQSEYLVARHDAPAAIEALRARSPLLRGLTQTCEIRTVAADALWMSPQYERASVGLHFTWRREPERVRRALAEVEAALEPFAPRPHWGKLFLVEAAAVAPRYPRHADFVTLAGRLDPAGTFRNDWARRHLLAAA